MANNSFCEFGSDEDKGNSVINQFGNPTYDNFLIFDNEIDSNCNDVENHTCFESDTSFQSHDSVNRPKPRERTTIKKKNSNDIVYSNVPLISDKYNSLTNANFHNDCVTQTEMSVISTERKSDDLPKLITELETILNCLNNDKFLNNSADNSFGDENCNHREISSPENSPSSYSRPQIIPRRSLSHGSSTSTSSSSLSTRPLPEPPKDIPPPKPPHLPPEAPPPPPPECFSPPEVPPRFPAHEKVLRDNVDLEDRVVHSPRKLSEPYLTQKTPIGIARSQTVKESDRPKIEILKPKILNKSKELGLLQKCGHLWKTGGNRKEFLDRWCVLHKNDLNIDEAVLAYYIDRKTTSARGKILLKDVAFVKITPSITSKTKLPNSSNIDVANFCFFEIGVNCKRGRVYLFAAKCLSDQKLWITAVSQAIAWNTIPIKDIYQSGYVHVKYGISGQWITNFVILSGKTILIISKETADNYDSQSNSSEDSDSNECYKSYDLRKVMSITFASVHQISSCATVAESGQPICITLPHKVIYMQAEYKSHAELWYQSLVRLWSVPENSKLEDQYLTNDNIPVAIDKCINFISTYGIETANVFLQQNFQSPIAAAIVDAFHSNAWELQLKYDTHSVHDITTALTLFLRSMSECILTEKLYHNWIKANEVENRNERLKKFKLLLHLLPKVNFATLKKMIAHLVCVIENSEKNQTCILNIAPVICQSILFLKVGDKIIDDRVSTFDGDSAGIDIVTDFILSYGWLFDVTTQELEKERKIQRAMELLKEAKHREFGQLNNNKSIDSEEFLIGVYIYSKEWGKCLNVRLTPTMTASDLIDYVVRQANLKENSEKLSVFEIVNNGQLERMLHYSDIVLGVTLSWVKWSQEYAKDNYLCVKINKVYEKILPHITEQTPITIFSELRYADKSWKNFKKVLVEFIGAKLSLYKDEKGEKSLGQWNIEDITWYLGAEKKRSVSNKLSITFIEKNKSVSKSKDSQYFGRTICCNAEDEYYKLIAGMLCAEYPNGVIPVRSRTDLLT